MGLVMLVYFLSSYDSVFFFSLLIGIPIFLFVLTSPVFAFYWVFRNPNNRETDYKFIRASSARLSLICVATSLVIIALAKSGWLFENQLDVNRLLFISLIVAVLAIALGILSLQQWQGFIVLIVALANYFLIWVLVLFIEPQYYFHQ